MLLPHELFSSIYHSYKGAWRQSLYGSADSICKFWQAQASHPQMAGHPVSFKPNRFTLAIPLSLHGDDVPVTGVGKAWTGKLTQWCWASLLGRGATSEVLFWIYGLFERLRVILTAGSESTLHTFFRILRWSFHWLFKGVFPDRDHDGVTNNYFSTVFISLDHSGWFLLMCIGYSSTFSKSPGTPRIRSKARKP